MLIANHPIIHKFAWIWANGLFSLIIYSKLTNTVSCNSIRISQRTMRRWALRADEWTDGQKFALQWKKQKRERDTWTHTHTHTLARRGHELQYEIFNNFFRNMFFLHFLQFFCRLALESCSPDAILFLFLYPNLTFILCTKIICIRKPFFIRLICLDYWRTAAKCNRMNLFFIIIIIINILGHPWIVFFSSSVEVNERKK